MNRLRQSVIVRYALAIGLVALAEYLRVNLPPAWAPPHWAVLFYPAVLLSAWFGGFGPGFVTTLGSVTIVALLVMHGRLSMQMVDVLELLIVVAFVVLCLATSIIAGTTRREAI